MLPNIFRSAKDNHLATQRLRPVNIERSECLKSWVRGGVVRGWRKELLVNVKGSRCLCGAFDCYDLVQHHAKTGDLQYRNYSFISR